MVDRPKEIRAEGQKLLPRIRAKAKTSLRQTLSLTASVIGNSCRFADRRVATRASREGPGESDDEASPHGGDRVRDVAFGSDRRRLWVGNPGEWQIARAAGRKVVLRGNGAPFGDQEAVGGDAECGVMVEAAPPAPFIITKAEFLLELLIIALDPPPQLCQINQTVERDILGQSGKPIFGRFGFVLRPLDQQPLFGA